MSEDYGSQFMLQEYTRIIDAYHDLHRQKDALIKFYLAFVSLPVSVVAIFLALSRFFRPSHKLEALLQPKLEMSCWRCRLQESFYRFYLSLLVSRF